jgi:aminopeptidase N
MLQESSDFHVHIGLVDPPEGLTIAASAVGSGPAGGDYLLCHGRTFAWSASTSYEQLSSAAGDATVTLYVLAADAPAGPSALDAATGALEAFSADYAPYPHASLAVVEADFFDGMEYDGLVYVGREYFQDYRYSPANYLTTLTAHEVAHQWWYALVGNDPAMEPWLDEGLATYSESLFYERVHPGLRDWWWRFRVERFDPQGWVDSSVYEHGAFRPYVDAVYLRGALFLEEIRQAMGDEAFFAFLRDYVAHHTFGVATATDLFEVMDRWGGEGVSAIRATYFRSSPPAAQVWDASARSLRW